MGLINNYIDFNNSNMPVKYNIYITYIMGLFQVPGKMIEAGIATMKCGMENSAKVMNTVMNGGGKHKKRRGTKRRGTKRRGTKRRGGKRRGTKRRGTKRR